MLSVLSVAADESSQHSALINREGEAKNEGYDEQKKKLVDWLVRNNWEAKDRIRETKGLSWGNTESEGTTIEISVNKEQKSSINKFYTDIEKNSWSTELKGETSPQQEKDQQTNTTSAPTINISLSKTVAYLVKLFPQPSTHHYYHCW